MCFAWLKYLKFCCVAVLKVNSRPGSAPIWGGKKGEFRDWTRLIPAKPAWFACGRSQVLDVCIRSHLPLFQVIEIEALSIRKNLDHQSGIDRCGRDNPVSCRKPTFSRAKILKASEGYTNFHE